MADGFELRQSLSSTISSLLQEKVVMQSKIYYQCDILTAPSESYVKDKTKPKRALILVVSFVTSIILGIFLVFFLEFIKKD
jgi:capsular polysaccharide biosynthesis protein